MVPAASDPLTIEMPTRLWACIDAEMDNASQTAVQLGDPDGSAVALTVREAGWAQVPWVDGAWPPGESMLAITLARAQWQLALSALTSAAPVYEELADGETAELGRQAARLVERHLG